MRFLCAATVVLISSCSAFGADVKAVPAGSRVSSDGFDTYLAAALQKKKVSVVIVTEKEKAEYELQGVSDQQKAGWAKVVFMGQIHSDEQASVKLVDLKSGEVVFAYAVNKKNSLHGRQTAAEACAKHMKDVVAK